LISKPSVIKILWAFAALGPVNERNEIIRRNIDELQSQVSKQNRYEIDCIVFSYAAYDQQPSWVKEWTQKPGFCRIVNIYQVKLTYFIKYLDPVWIQKSKYDHVSVTMSDVVLYPPQSNFDLVSFMNFILKYNLDIATPAINQTVHPAQRPIPPQNWEPNQVGRLLTSIELQSTTFTVDAWACWWELNDTEFPSGWTDTFVYNYCVTSGRLGHVGKLGIMDTQHIHHVGLSSTNGDTSQIKINQTEAWIKDRGIPLVENYAETLTILYDKIDGIV
jgi:hypothetical protein